MTLDRTAHLDALDRDGAAFVAACERAGLVAPVTSCPGWTVADLLWHVVGVYSFFGTIVDERLTTIDSIVRAQRPDDAELAELCRRRHADLLTALARTSDDTPVWTWTDDRSVAFVRRRMAQETAVHRWDAELAAGDALPIDGALASDGIDEFLLAFLHRPGADVEAVGGSVHVHCADVPGEWTIRVDDPPSTGFHVTREHAKGDCALRGAASDLLLALWRRVPLSEIDVIGDADVARRFIAYPRL